MSNKIGWCDKTWNPIIGCNKISAGCDDCWAEKMAHRLSMISTTKYYKNVVSFRTGWNGKTHFEKSQLNKPFHWKKPAKIFVCSMSDLFHEATPFEWILQVWDLMCSNSQHTYQLLTKRPERVIEFLKWLGNMDCISVPDFIWIGVTTENQAMANRRIPELLKIPAKTKFISCEPLLSNIDLQPATNDYFLDGNFISYPGKEIIPNNVNWVIAGPETGQKARPMQKEWIENIYKQCKSANVPFFDKKDILGLNVKQFPKT